MIYMVDPKLKRRLDNLEEQVTSEQGRIEALAEMALWHAPEPEFTDYLASRGFVVEREERRHDNGHQDVLLHTTPSAADIFHSIVWHHEGPTLPRDEIRILWEDSALETVLSSTEHPAEHEPQNPDETTVVVEGDGWHAVGPSERVIENMVIRRSTAERHDFEILRSVPSSVEDADEYDLVEVNAELAPYSNRT